MEEQGGGRSNGSLALAGQESSSEGDEEDGTDGSSPEASYGSIAKLGAANGKPAEGDQVCPSFDSSSQRFRFLAWWRWEAGRGGISQ